MTLTSPICYVRVTVVGRLAAPELDPRLLGSARRAIARHRRQVDWRRDSGEGLLEPRAPLRLRTIAQIAAAFAPEPVIVRMSDFKSNEYANLVGGRAARPEHTHLGPPRGGEFAVRGA